VEFVLKYKCNVIHQLLFKILFVQEAGGLSYWRGEHSEYFNFLGGLCNHTVSTEDHVE